MFNGHLVWPLSASCLKSEKRDLTRNTALQDQAAQATSSRNIPSAESLASMFVQDESHEDLHTVNL